MTSGFTFYYTQKTQRTTSPSPFTCLADEVGFLEAATSVDTK